MGTAIILFCSVIVWDGVMMMLLKRAGESIKWHERLVMDAFALLCFLLMASTLW